MNGNQNDSNVNGLSNGNTISTTSGGGNPNNLNQSGVGVVNNSINGGTVVGTSSGVGSVSVSNTSSSIPTTSIDNQVSGSGFVNSGGVIGNVSSQQGGSTMTNNSSLQGSSGFQVSNGVNTGTNITINSNINTSSVSNSNPSTGGSAANLGGGFVQPPLINESANVSVGMTSFSGGIENDAVIDENLKRVEINHAGPSKSRTIFTIMLFVFIIAFVMFLPDITSLISQYKANKNQTAPLEVTSGKLECTLDNHTDTLDFEYLRVFKFTDKKLDNASYTLTTRGDVTLDETSLKELSNKCDLLSKYVSEVSGVEVKCTLSQGKLVEKQFYDFLKIDKENIGAAFSEAGGTYPNFNAGQDISTIEKTMLQAGYKCEKKK